jgi:hypothetical protein
MDSIPDRWTGWRGWAHDLAFVTAAGVCLGLVGPFGTYISPLANRLVYWVGLFWVGLLFYGPAIRAAVWAGRRSRAPGAIWLLLFVLVASVPMSVVASAVATRVWPQLKSMTPLAWYGQSVALSIPLAMLYGLITRGIAPFTRTETSPQTPGALAGRLPDRLVRGLVCLQMEDHYVRVHTAAGSELVLVSMRDAIAGLDPRLGARTHRSWWVARAAVAGVVADGRNLRLRLTNGVEAPVARSSVGMLRAAGWLDLPAPAQDRAEAGEARRSAR